MNPATLAMMYAANVGINALGGKRGSNLFKDSFIKRRCIVIANGYYEWKKINNNKIPFLISIPVLETIFFAAIWRVENINNNHVPVCCILTKEASDTIKSVHGRMPIIYSANDALTFLKEKETKTENSNLENDLDYYTVSKKINNPIFLLLKVHLRAEI